MLEASVAVGDISAVSVFPDVQLANEIASNKRTKVTLFV